MSDTTPDAGFLAGGRARRRHSLAGLPLGSAKPCDEFLHPPAACGHYSSTETSYYGFNVPERRLNDVMTIDGFFSRDRSWGQERRGGPRRLRRQPGCSIRGFRAAFRALTDP